MRLIMLATDFSERSDRALLRAKILAAQSGATLSIIHVVDDDQPPRIINLEKDLAESLLRELKASVMKAEGVECTSKVLLAAPHAGIVQAASQACPDLLIIGPHRRQALRDVFIGTTAERTIRSVECPVLMANAPPTGPYRCALLTTDFSEGARRAAQVFEKLELHQRIRVAMLHVFDVPAIHLALSHMMGTQERASIVTDERKIAARDLSAFAVSVGEMAADQVLCHAKRRPAQEILSAAQTEGADLIVVGINGKSGLVRFFLGSVAEEVLRGANCDVLAVPAKEDAAELTDMDRV